MNYCGVLMLWMSQACKDNVGHRTYLSVFRLIVARQLSLEAEVLEDVYWLQISEMLWISLFS